MTPTSAAGSKTLKVPIDGPLHKKLIARLSSRIRLAEQGQTTRHEKWQRAEEITLAYVHESEADAKRRTSRIVSGKQSYTTIQLPYSYAVLMSAHTYWTSVFFARSPVHQFMGRHGEAEQQTQAIEALISYQVEVGNMLGPYYIWLYDAGKYGCGILGQYWDVEKVQYGQLVSMVGPDGTSGVYQTTQEIAGYTGNKVYNVSPYDWMHDPRVPLGRFQDGEFCCARKRMGWHQILRRQDQGYFVNIDELKSHVGTDRGRTLGSQQLERPAFDRDVFLQDFDLSGGQQSQHPAGAVFWEIYVELVPSEWGVGTTNFPQKWCFTITEDLALIVGASPLGYIHAKFPFDVLEPEVEGYALFNRGIPEIMDPIQRTMDWLINVHFYNVRAALNNQFIVDPSKLVIKDAQNADAGFLWRLRPEAYGADISKMFMQVPVQDMTRGNMSDLQSMMSFGERTIGVNDQIMGALGGTQRKTATEVRTTTGFGVNRMKTITEYLSATGFSPHAQKLVQTSQQLYDAQAKLRITGDLTQSAGAGFMNVTPENIAGFFDFVPVDGTLPIDRMAQANLWKEMMGSLRMMPPQVAMGYDWTRIFAWVASLAGLKNINQFKVQVVPDQQLAQQAQAGNVIPMPQRQIPSPIAPGNSASTAAGLNSLAPQTDDSSPY